MIEMSEITTNVKRILSGLPPGVELVAAAKGRHIEAIKEAIEAGITIIGENYIQEAEAAFQSIGRRVKWHLIGHLQKNKIKKAVGLFDMVQTVDSIVVARELDARCKQAGKSMPVLIEVNSGREPAKSGVLPENVESLVREIATLHNINIQGLMTMGPVVDNAEKIKPFFVLTRRIYEALQTLGLQEVEMKYLSMGMSDSYTIAVSEGANIVRIGREIFGK
jgi:pyridoxal phosphate enzyme (YggS family)